MALSVQKEQRIILFRFSCSFRLRRWRISWIPVIEESQTVPNTHVSGISLRRVSFYFFIALQLCSCSRIFIQLWIGCWTLAPCELIKLNWATNNSTSCQLHVTISKRTQTLTDQSRFWKLVIVIETTTELLSNSFKHLEVKCVYFSKVFAEGQNFSLKLFIASKLNKPYLISHCKVNNRHFRDSTPCINS